MLFSAIYLLSLFRFLEKLFVISEKYYLTMGHLYFLCQPSTAHTAPVLDSQVISGAVRASAGPTALETISLGHRRTPEPLHGPFPPSIWLLLIKQWQREHMSVSQVCVRYSGDGL